MTLIVVPTLTRPDVPLRVVSVAAVPTIFPTVILGVPDKPVALPVSAPTKVVAVHTPETFLVIGFLIYTSLITVS